MREDDRQLGIAVEGTLAGDALEQDTAERVDVRPRVDRFTLDLLRRHVVDRSDEAAVAGEAARRRHVTGEPEVADVCVLALRRRCDQDVARLDITMDKPGSVRGVKCTRSLLDEIDRPVGLEATLAAQYLPEIRTVDQLHDEVQASVLLSRTERWDDVRIVEARCELGLAQEALPEALVARERCIEELERDDTIALNVMRAIDLGHRTPAEGRLDPEACDNRPGCQPRRHLSIPSIPPASDRRKSAPLVTPPLPSYDQPHGVQRGEQG